jgi:hypothetical protein
MLFINEGYTTKAFLVPILTQLFSPNTVLTRTTQYQSCGFRVLPKGHRSKSLTTQCGTPGYVARKFWKARHYDLQADA